MAKGCALSTGYLPRGGLPKNSVDRITGRPDMTSVVDRGRKASTQTNPNKNKCRPSFDLSLLLLTLKFCVERKCAGYQCDRGTICSDRRDHSTGTT